MRADRWHPPSRTGGGDLKAARAGEQNRSLAQERRSVRAQAPLQDRFSESFTAWRSGIEEAARDGRGPARGDGRRAESDGSADESCDIYVERFGRADRQCLQRLATGRGRIPGRFGLRRNLARAAVVRGNRVWLMRLDRRQAEGAMIRDRQPRNRGQRHRCPAKGHRSRRAQHDWSLP